MRLEEASAHLAKQIARARRAIAVERAVPAITPGLLLIGVWASIALLGLHDRLPALAGTLSAIAALALIVFLFARGARNYRKPTDQDARERLAREANLDAHSFDALEDQPSRLDPLGLALWRREQDRALEVAAKLNAKPARIIFGRADILRLRFVLPVLLVVGLFVAGLQAPDRLARAFIPDPGPLLGDKTMEIEAWATPADYTGAAPILLSDKLGKTIEAPPSVDVTARVMGPVGAPFLIFNGGGQERKIKFAKAADGAWEAKIKIEDAGTLRVVRFHTKARWRIAPGKDAAPTSKFVGKPVIEDEAVAFSWAAKDDYGVRDLYLRITPAKPPPGLADAPPRDVPIEAPTSEPKDAEGAAKVELIDHPYAGMDVQVRVVAKDALGQEGVSSPAKLKLPEKIFLQPLARAAIEIRRDILWERRPYAVAPKVRKDDLPPRLAGNDILFGTGSDPILTDEYDPRIERAPAAIRRAGHMLDALTAYPEDGYFQDTAVFMGLKGARSALNVARSIEETDHAAEILWQVAMRAEYGDSADARRALLEAQRALSQAIENGASKEEIERLTQAMRQAMQNYMQALVQEAIRNGESQQTQEDTRERTQMSQQDIQDILDEIQRRTEAGDTEGAQQLLQQLSQMLDNLEIQLSNQSGGGQGGQEGENDAELNESVEGLSDAIGKQRALRDETGKEGEQGSPGERQGKGQELGQRQQQLRRELEELREGSREAGPDGKDLGEAARNMGEAEQRLRQGDLEGAERAQDEALKNMRAGADRLSQELLKREDERNGSSKANEQRRSGEQDPLGRNVGAGNSSGDEVTVPEATERQRARDILDELRKRAQDPRRPESERDYLRRLLERFTGS
jgi:hypothetical protein